MADLNLSDVEEYNKIVIPVFRMIGSNLEENQKLQSLRDTLLPRLMSGELSVADTSATLNDDLPPTGVTIE